jgi:starvation-inducible DNA-binding protein
MFQTLHLMFEDEYDELATAVDAIAERIRSRGAPAPGSYRELTVLSSVPEDEDRPDAEEMICRLVAEQEAVARTTRLVSSLVEAAHDEVTADMLTQWLEVHEKTAWTLRSLLA